MALVAGCGGGGGTSQPPGNSERVALLDNTSYTPWSSGHVGFRIEPPLSISETASCSIDGSAASACSTNAARGDIAYAGLSSGSHNLHVTIQGSAGSRSYRLPWRIGQPDVVVVGGTPGGIAAALAAARGGKTVVLMESSRWLGGMMSGGLSQSDVGGSHGEPLGGIVLEFFDRVRDYEVASGACAKASSCLSYWDFEPHAASVVFDRLLAEQPNIYVQRSLSVDAVRKRASTIASVETARGSLNAAVYVDASYEGDLTAAAGATTIVGREARLSGREAALHPDRVEDDAGFRGYRPTYGVVAVDPYVVPGDPGSGLIPFVEPPPTKEPVLGSADTRVMAYNYRLCVTDDPSNRVPFTKPAGYEPDLYEASARVAVARSTTSGIPLEDVYFNPAATVRSKDDSYYKRDLNGGSPFSTDMSLSGWNQAYPTASPSQRARIALDYQRYIQGLLYFWQTDPRLGALNAKVAAYGLCKDEFEDNGHWPYRLYTRETRRMVGEYVMNQNDVLQNGRRSRIADSVAVGTYSMDNHIRQYTVDRQTVGGVRRTVIVTEGAYVTRLPGYEPYPVSYRSLLPQRAQVTNLINPVTLSSTAVAYSSLRMEPTFMMLGQAAGTAAAMAVDRDGRVHDVDVAALRSALKADGMRVD